jgi:CDP-diglyceride synthetase
MFKFAKKLGSSILDSLLGFIFGIVCVVLVAAIIIKTINLGTKHWNRGVERPRNPHRKLAAIAVVGTVGDIALSLVNYHLFLNGKGALDLIVSIACLVAAVIMGFVASGELKKCRTIRL